VKGPFATPCCCAIRNRGTSPHNLLSSILSRSVTRFVPKLEDGSELSIGPKRNLETSCYKFVLNFLRIFMGAWWIAIKTKSDGKNRSARPSVKSPSVELIVPHNQKIMGSEFKTLYFAQQRSQVDDDNA
jgi:hypothetical protein